MSRAQAKALLQINRENDNFPGISTRQPTIKALLRMGLVYREWYETDRAEGYRYPLTPAGKKRAEELIEFQKKPYPVDDPYENWESYDLG